jgi:hypothetical protein
VQLVRRDVRGAVLVQLEEGLRASRKARGQRGAAGAAPIACGERGGRVRAAVRPEARSAYGIVRYGSPPSRHQRQRLC